MYSFICYDELPSSIVVSNQLIPTTTTSALASACGAVSTAAATATDDHNDYSINNYHVLATTPTYRNL